MPIARKFLDQSKELIRLSCSLVTPVK